jgi:hypothetical protein
MVSCCQMHGSTVENIVVELKKQSSGRGWLYLARLKLITIKIWLNIWMESRIAKRMGRTNSKRDGTVSLSQGRTWNDDWRLGIEQIFYLDRTPVRNARRCDLFPLGPSPLDKIQKYNNVRAERYEGKEVKNKKEEIQEL